MIALNGYSDVLGRADRCLDKASARPSLCDVQNMIDEILGSRAGWNSDLVLK